MTVADLIRELQSLPPDFSVYREGGEYNGDTRRVERIDVYRQGTWGQSPGVVLR